LAFAACAIAAAFTEANIADDRIKSQDTLELDE